MSKLHRHHLMGFRLTSKSLNNVRHLFTERRYSVMIGESEVPISLEESVLISGAMYRHFARGNTAFLIDIYHASELCHGGEKDKLISLFTSLKSLIYEKDYIEIHKSDIPALNYLGEILENDALRRSFNPLLGSSTINRISFTSKWLSSGARREGSAKFCFKVCSQRFECHRILAALLSSKVSRITMSDAVQEEIELMPPKGCEPEGFTAAFELIFSLLSGHSLKISQTNCCLVGILAKMLENEELMRAVDAFKSSLEKTDLTNVYERLRSLSLGPSLNDYSDVIGFAASHFADLNLNSIVSTSVPILLQIIESPSLVIENEHQLLHFVMSVIEAQGKSAYTLLSSVKLEYIDGASMRTLVKSISADMISADLWNALGKRLECDIFKEEKPSKRWKLSEKSIPQKHIDELTNEIAGLKSQLDAQQHSCKATEFPLVDPKDGIFAYFCKLRSKANPHTSGFVNASSSSEFGNNSPMNVLVWGTEKCWDAAGTTNEWIQVSFLDFFFILKHFSIQAEGEWFPKKWVLRGSMIANQFEDIKTFENEEQIKGEGKVGVFHVDCSKPYRSFRIVQLDETFGGPEHYFNFYSLEFFGTLLLPPGVSSFK